MQKTKLSPKKLSYFLMFAYMVSYMTRINFGGVILEMSTATGFSKTQLSAAVTGSFITYGIGQVISGWFGDKFQPKSLVLAGFLTTSAMNLLIPFCPSPFFMTAVWCINGLAQAFMWPPIVRIMVNLLTPEEYVDATVTVSYGSAAGTMAVYLITPVIISVCSWKWVFVFSAVCGLVTSVVWYKFCPLLSVIKLSKKTASKGVAKIIFSPLIIAVMLGIISQGSLRDGITTWMPAYISETYNLSNSIAILTGVILPVFTMICIKATASIYTRRFKNTLTCAGIIFLVGVLSSLLLLVSTGKSAVSSVVLSATLTGCMHGVNYLFIQIVPSYFKSTGFVSLISGILNACTYIGSAISTYGIAVLTESFGWKPTIIVWAGVAFFGMALSFAFAPVWKKKYIKD